MRFVHGDKLRVSTADKRERTGRLSPTGKSPRSVIIDTIAAAVRDTRQSAENATQSVRITQNPASTALLTQVPQQ